MLEVLDSRQIAEWLAYHAIEPFGHDAEWRRAGTSAAAVYNVFRKKGARQIRADDFVPRVPEPKRKQTPEEQKKALMELVAALESTGTVVKRVKLEKER